MVLKVKVLVMFGLSCKFYLYYYRTQLIYGRYVEKRMIVEVVS